MKHTHRLYSLHEAIQRLRMGWVPLRRNKLKLLDLTLKFKVMPRVEYGHEILKVVIRGRITSYQECNKEGKRSRNAVVVKCVVK